MFPVPRQGLEQTGVVVMVMSLATRMAAAFVGAVVVLALLAYLIG